MLFSDLIHGGYVPKQTHSHLHTTLLYTCFILSARPAALYLQIPLSTSALRSNYTAATAADRGLDRAAPNDYFVGTKQDRRRCLSVGLVFDKAIGDIVL